MKTYSKSSTCSKCGSGRHKIQYITKRVIASHDPVKYEDVEYIKVWCQNCAHVRHMACQDSEQEN